MLAVGVFVLVATAGLMWSRSQRQLAELEDLPDTINVGSRSADVVLVDGGIAKLTIPGFVTRQGNMINIVPSSVRFHDEINQVWITLDDGRVVNRNHIAWLKNMKWVDFEAEVPKA